MQACLHLAKSRDAKVTRPIVVLSQARDCAAVADAPPVPEDQGCAVLSFESPSSRRLVPGVPLSGALTVAPLRSFSARGIRLDLVLSEHVLHGPRLTADSARNPAYEEKYAAPVVASLPLAEQVRWIRPGPLRHGFTVPVPPPAAHPDDADAEPHLELDAPRRGRQAAAPGPICGCRVARGDDPAMSGAKRRFAPE